jgi:hypothetical protein
MFKVNLKAKANVYEVRLINNNHNHDVNEQLYKMYMLTPPAITSTIQRPKNKPRQYCNDAENARCRSRHRRSSSKWHWKTLEEKHICFQPENFKSFLTLM